MTTSAPLSTFIIVSFCSINFYATAEVGNAGPGSNTKSEMVRIDLLQADMITPITKTEELAFERYVQMDPNGLYTIKVVSVGLMKVVRMKGTYLDSTLTVPHGQFVYYHMNGRVESKGDYKNGVKSGIWERNSISGHELAEKVYTGRSIEQTLVDADQISIAATLGTSRKFSVAIEF